MQGGVVGDDFADEADLMGPPRRHPLRVAEQREVGEIAVRHALRQVARLVRHRHVVGDVVVGDVQTSARSGTPVCR